MTATLDSSPVNGTAAADLSSKLFRFGKLTSTGVNVCDTLGERADRIIGKHQKKTPAAGDAVDSYLERVMLLEAGGSFSAGAKLTTDANGKGVTASDGHYINAIAIDASGGDGELVRVQAPLGAVPASTVDSLVSVSASGAIPPTADYVLMSTDGTKAYTLADGEDGHEITLDWIAGTNTPIGTLTIATPYTSQPATHVIRSAGARLTLRMTASGWKLVDKKRAGSLTVVVGDDDLTGEDMVETYNLSITDTVSSTGAKAIPDGLIDGEMIEVRCTTAGGTPAGSIDGTYKSLAAAATTHAAVNNTGDYFVARWCNSGSAAWLVQFSNSVTFS